MRGLKVGDTVLYYSRRNSFEMKESEIVEIKKYENNKIYALKNNDIIFDKNIIKRIKRGKK